MNPKILKVYNHSPIWLQNLMVSCYGVKLFYQRYGSAYRHAFHHYINKDYSNEAQELKNQNEELIKLLHHATTQSPFFHQLYSDIDISTIRSPADLPKLPILEKEHLRAHIDAVRTIHPSRAISAFTGGTTGKSLQIYYKKEDFQKRMAYLDAFKHRLGINTFLAKKATFSGREFTDNAKSKRMNVYWRNNWIYRQRLYSTFDMTPQNLPFYVKDLNRFKPDVLNGFVSAIYDLAAYIQTHKLVLHFIPKAIFTTSETLLPHHRQLIETVFRSKIYNQYASAEGAPFITECKYGNLHYNLDTGVIEVVDTSVGPETLVTSFTTYGTPIIRYRIGDQVVFKEGKCPCGSSHPLVASIEGRQVDFLQSKERGKISLSHMADVIKGMPNSVINMQFVQNQIDEIVVNLVVDERYFTDAHRTSIEDALRFRFGNDSSITFNFLDHIPRESSGKLRLIKNNIQQTGVV